MMEPRAPEPLPPDVFLHSFTLVPRAAVCLLARDAKGDILRRGERKA